MAAYEAVLFALADGTRRDILDQLAVRPAAVSQLADRLPVSRPAVSQHLRILLDAGLVQFDAEGTRNVYRLEREGFDVLRSWLDSFWQHVLDAFESHANQLPASRGEP